MADRDEVVKDLLLLIQEAAEPLGAGALRWGLQERGHGLSEATVGRLLGDLEAQGFLEKDRNKGRRLTPEGRKHLALLEQASVRDSAARDFVDSVLSQDRDRILELLEARRAVEQETARLAAQHATEEDVEDLRRSVQVLETQALEGRGVSEEDTRFHRVLARAGGNRLLGAAVDLLRQNPFYARELEIIRREVGRGQNPDHRRILEAVEQHDSELAELAMRRHLDNLMEDCRRFWNR